MAFSIRGLFALFLAAHLATSQYIEPPIVTIADGVLEGTTGSVPGASTVVNKFLGVPYAQSPPKRFEPPSPPTPWNEPRSAKNWTAACIQQFTYPPQRQAITKQVFNSPGGTPPSESEDCLYLNVYAPSTPPPAGGRAVMFWIYGGAFQFGTAMQSGYDGTTLAAKHDVIVVAANYRTNVFGFSGSPALPITQQNIGLLDQRFALQWVQANIARFGGDAAKVTIFGESAGGASVDRLVTSYPDHAPFRAAILQSGQATFGDLSFDSAQVNAASWTSLLKLLNYTGDASTPEALSFAQQANATLIKNLIEVNSLSFAPIVDNVTSVGDVVGAFRDKRVAQVPLLEGTNSQEGKIFQLGQLNLTSFLISNFPNVTQRNLVRDAFPAQDPNNAYNQISQIYTQSTFACPQAQHVSLATQNGLKVWRYYYDAAFNNTNPLASLGIDLGVFHSSEISIVFGSYPENNVTAQQYALSEYLQTAWTRFAKDPEYGPGWGPVGSYGGLDLAALGSNGTSGPTLIRSAVADYACDIIEQPVQGFNPAY